MPADASPISADVVKATFLYKFVPFVEWPASSPAGSGMPVVICVVGVDPFGPALEQSLAAQHLGDRPIVVRPMLLARPNSGCQVMYITGSDTQSIDQALKIVRGEPILTVTDEATSKGIVDFNVVQGRVRFRLDQQAAVDNGLRLRAPLLALAVSVVPERGPK